MTRRATVWRVKLRHKRLGDWSSQCEGDRWQDAAVFAQKTAAALHAGTSAAEWAVVTASEVEADA